MVGPQTLNLRILVRVQVPEQPPHFLVHKLSTLFFIKKQNSYNRGLSIYVLSESSAFDLFIIGIGSLEKKIKILSL